MQQKYPTGYQFIHPNGNCGFVGGYFNGQYKCVVNSTTDTCTYYCDEEFIDSCVAGTSIQQTYTVTAVDRDTGVVTITPIDLLDDTDEEIENSAISKLCNIEFGEAFAAIAEDLKGDPSKRLKAEYSDEWVSDTIDFGHGIDEIPIGSIISYKLCQNHTWIDTGGLMISYCRTCDAKGAWDRVESNYKEIE